MTFLTPRNLSSMAAKVFVEDLIFGSTLFSHLNVIRDTVASYDMKSLMDKIYFDCEVKELNQNIIYIDEIIGKMLKYCSPKTEESILHILRTTDHDCSAGAIIMQFLFDKEVDFRKKHWILFPILVSVQHSYTNVEKLLFDSMGEQSSLTFLGQFLQFLPNLKVFKGVITMEGKFLNSLRSNCPKIIELTLCAKEGFITSNQLASLFFSGKSLDAVKKAFVKLDNAPLSFPKLESFSINGVGYEQYDFFKMFFHFYNKVNFVVSLHHNQLYFNLVSWFDAVLSHSVIINPDLNVTQCDLNVHDLYLPFCERSLVNWKNLESLLISLGIQGKKTPSTSTNIGKRLEALISKQGRIKDLCIKIQGPVSEEEVSEILFPTFRKHGNRFRQLKIVGLTHFLSHRSIVQVLNMCPNIKKLVLIGKRIMKYFKDVKLKSLTNLESLTVIWSDVQTNTTFCQWISKLTSDLLKNSPVLKYLYCTANFFLMDHMTRIKFGSELENLIIYFHIEKFGDEPYHLKSILSRLPKLKQLVVQDNTENKCPCYLAAPDFFEYECNCTTDKWIDRIYDVVKSYVDNTQIYTRHFTVEDAQIAMCL